MGPITMHGGAPFTRGRACQGVRPGGQGNEFRLTDFAGGGHVGRSWVQSDGGSPQWLHDFVSKPLLFRPGTYFRSATGSVPTKSVNLNSLPWVASMATSLHPSDDSHSERASSSRVVVPKVRTSRSTLPSRMRRRQATTESLCASRPAQSG